MLATAHSHVQVVYVLAVAADIGDIKPSWLRNLLQQIKLRAGGRQGGKDQEKIILPAVRNGRPYRRKRNILRMQEVGPDARCLVNKIRGFPDADHHI